MFVGLVYACWFLVNYTEIMPRKEDSQEDNDYLEF
jgi:hypothetical protein